MEKVTKYFILYLMAFSAVLALTFPYNYTFSDEGTHFLLAVFYKDLLSNIPSLGFSYDAIYNYSINYLVHYPKLQIAYPPVYHLTALIPFYVLGPSIFLLRLVNLAYAALAFFVFYSIVKKHFDEKTAFISTLFFSLSTYSLLYASRAFQDFSAFFFIMLSVWFFSKAVDSKQTKYFLILGVTSALAILSKQISAILVIFFLVCMAPNLRRMQGIKQLAAFAIPLIILLTPYILLLKSVGGFEINKIVAIDYASQQGEPTSLIDPAYWLHFLLKPSYFAPFTIAFALVLFAYIYKKEKYWKEFLVFSLIFYISLSVIPNKELRFSQLFLLPAYVATAAYLLRVKNRLVLPATLVAYTLISIVIFSGTVQSYPQSEIADRIYKSLPDGAAVSLFSDQEPLFSSSLMAELIIKDKKGVVVIRPCAFGNKTKEEILKTLDESNTYFVVYSTWSEDTTIGKVLNSLEPAFSVTENNLTTDVYKYKNFQNKMPEKACNYICLTGGKICERK